MTQKLINTMTRLIIYSGSFISIFMIIHVHPFLPLPVSIHPSILSSHPHHADLSHLSLQLGSRHVLKVVVIAALSAPGVRLHDEVLHVQRSTRDSRRVRCLAYGRAELGRSVVSPGLLVQNECGQIEGVEGRESRFIHHFITRYVTAASRGSRACTVQPHALFFCASVSNCFAESSTEGGVLLPEGFSRSTSV